MSCSGERLDISRGDDLTVELMRCGEIKPHRAELTVGRTPIWLRAPEEREKLHLCEEVRADVMGPDMADEQTVACELFSQDLLELFGDRLCRLKGWPRLLSESESKEIREVFCG